MYPVSGIRLSTADMPTAVVLICENIAAVFGDQGFLHFQDKFSSRQDVRMLKLNEKLPEYSSNNSSSLAELFVGFLHYYAFKFE